MEAKDVRIGNYVYMGVALDVVKLKAVNPQTGFISMCEPIPITEGMLVKLGFEKINTLVDDTIVFKGHPYLYFKDGIVSISIKTPQIKYVHQLQNLYYVLTGIELYIKKNT